MRIYRVVQGEESKAYSVGVLPAGIRDTGFWSTDPERTRNLLHEHEKFSYSIDGGFPWPGDLIVLETDLSNVDTSNCLLAERKMSVHNDKFDEDEIFVCDIKDQGKVLRKTYTEWLREHGFSRW